MDTCDYPGCSNPIAQKCNRCGGAFCPRHCRFEQHGTEYSSTGFYICDQCYELRQDSGYVVAYVVLRATRDEALDWCEKAVQACGAKIRSADRAAGKIVAQRGVSFPSWGETVVITLQEAPGNYQRARINSKPRLATNIVDGGRNKANVEIVRKALESLAAAK